MRELYLYLSSNSCKDIYPSNNANAFRVKLPQTLHLYEAEKWSVALLDINLPKLEEGYKPGYITLESSVCKPSVYKNGSRQVLHRLYFSQIRKGSPIMISSPRYVQLNVSHIDTFDMCITDSSGQIEPFKKGTVDCTLHLLKQE